MKGSELVRCLIGYENVKTIKNWLYVKKHYYFKNILINQRNNQVFQEKLYSICSVIKSLVEHVVVERHVHDDTRFEDKVREVSSFILLHEKFPQYDAICN